MISIRNKNLVNIFEYIKENELESFIEWLLNEIDQLSYRRLGIKKEDLKIIEAHLDNVRDNIQSTLLAAIACATDGHVYADTTRLWYDVRHKSYPKISPKEMADLKKYVEEVL